MVREPKEDPQEELHPFGKAIATSSPDLYERLVHSLKERDQKVLKEKEEEAKSNQLGPEELPK